MRVCHGKVYSNRSDLLPCIKLVHSLMEKRNALPLCLLRDQSKLRKHKMRGSDRLCAPIRMCAIVLPAISPNTPTPRKQQATINYPMRLFFWQYAGVFPCRATHRGWGKKMRREFGNKDAKARQEWKQQCSFFFLFFLFFGLANHAKLYAMGSTLQLVIFCEELQRPHHLLRGKQVGTHTSRRALLLSHAQELLLRAAWYHAGTPGKPGVLLQRRISCLHPRPCDKAPLVPGPQTTYLGGEEVHARILSR